MSQKRVSETTGSREVLVGKLKKQRFMIVLAFVFAITCVVGSSLVFAGRSQNSRPRNAVTVQQPKPTPTATPVPRSTPPPVTPASTPIRSATPPPTQKPTPYDRIAPNLGEPPPPPVLKPKPTPEPTDEDFGEGSIIRVNTELVTLNVRVIDRNNRPIGNVQQNEFHVLEDGVPQPIEYFTREEVPISYGLAVDTSGSLRSQLQSVIDAGKTIVMSNRPGDETFLVRFISSDKIETVQDFTSNQELLIDGIDSLYVEGGQTAVVDAVYLTAAHVAEYKKGDDNDRRRRAMIVITDGEDRNSFYSPDKLFASLREADVQIYVIGFVNELDKEGGLIRKSPKDKAVNLLNKIASETGGRAFFPNSLSELPQIANEIVRDLRTQYVVAYNPTNKVRDGSFRSIKVSVDEGASRDKRIALTRNGRTAPKGEPPPPKIPASRPAAKPVAGSTKSP
jgi:Ca-activated chloride channel homolog